MKASIMVDSEYFLVAVQLKMGLNLEDRNSSQFLSWMIRVACTTDINIVRKAEITVALFYPCK